MKACTILSLALAALCAASTASATTYDASADFSGVSNPNPNGAWSEGYTTTLGSALVLHSQYTPNYSLNVNAWNSANAVVFEKNVGATTTFGIAPGQAALHPGSGNQYAVLRFTAPGAGSFTIAAQFFVGDTGDTDANILLNSNAGSPVFFATTTNTNPSYGGTLNLQAGDTVDFVVGSKGGFQFDTTPIAVSITSSAAVGGRRTSANYSILTDTAGSGGRRTTSASYTSQGSAGGVVGISTVASPVETAKHGYLGQITEVTGLTLTSAALTVNETATVQLAAWRALDDATFLTVPAASVAWSVQSGPLTGISAGGVATAGIVYQDTAATAQGIYLGDTATQGLTVWNTNLDNFGS